MLPFWRLKFGSGTWIRRYLVQMFYCVKKTGVVSRCQLWALRNVSLFHGYGMRFFPSTYGLPCCPYAGAVFTFHLPSTYNLS